jgi:prevent-host-death family protein
MGHAYDSNAMSTAAARARFAEVVNRAAFGKERVVLGRRGRALVAVVPIEDVRLLEELEDQRDLDDARAARAEADAEGTVAWETLRAEARSRSEG